MAVRNFLESLIRWPNPVWPDRYFIDVSGRETFLALCRAGWLDECAPRYVPCPERGRFCPRRVFRVDGREGYDYVARPELHFEGHSLCCQPTFHTAESLHSHAFNLAGLTRWLREHTGARGRADRDRVHTPGVHHIGWQGERQVLYCNDPTHTQLRYELLRRSHRRELTTILFAARGDSGAEFFADELDRKTVGWSYLVDMLRVVDGEVVVLAQPKQPPDESDVFPRTIAKVLSHDGLGVVEHAEYAEIVEERDSYDLLVDALAPGSAHRCYRRELDGTPLERTTLSSDETALLLELVRTKGPLRLRDFQCRARFKCEDDLASFQKVVERVRRKVDLPLDPGSRRGEYRAIKTRLREAPEDKWFHWAPPAHFRLSIILPLTASVPHPRPGTDVV